MIIFKNLMCNIGLHWLEGHKSLFADTISGKTVFKAKCQCGIEWLTDSMFPINVSKVRNDDDR